jgi:hypothetical protein
MTLHELGNQVGGMDYAAVSVGLRRFDSRLKQDRKMRGDFKNIVEMLNVTLILPSTTASPDSDSHQGFR